MKSVLMFIGLLVFLVCGFCFFPSCSQELFTFTAVSEHGFGVIDHESHHNDYPWSMVYFSPDLSDKSGKLYVGTGNALVSPLLKRIFEEFGLNFNPQPYMLPPEIRRYRPDKGKNVWETVFDYREIETAPDWKTTGIRSMGVYNAPHGKTYLYAGTFGITPTLWRSKTGDYGTWEKVWSAPVPGTVRSFAEHKGLFYFSVTQEASLEKQRPGKIYATDGKTIWPVIEDGFGNPRNVGIYSIVSFEGHLYAGTYNKVDGYEIWRLADDNVPEPVVKNGGPSPSNQAVASMKVFKGHLYAGSLITGGIDLGGGGRIMRGADMIRISSDGSWETVVGPGSQTPSGFGRRTNAYFWILEEYNDRLYCGVWDSTSLLRIIETYMPQLIEQFPETDLWIPFILEWIRTHIINPVHSQSKNRRNLFQEGAELYVTDNGVDWQPVFRDGLGNKRNFGVRQLEVMGDHLFIGLVNIWDGLIIYKMSDEAGNTARRR